MKAILLFRDWKNIDFESSITQKQNEGTHKLLNGANDFCGRSSKDQCDLLAPYDCVVKAIGTYDNTCFFESLELVETPIGKYKCWFMCAHCNDADIQDLGIKVGKTFKQGERCYMEGVKGIGSGNHIHMEQGIGEFGGGNKPYYASSDYFWYNGKKYQQYYPNVKDGGYECPVQDIFYLRKDVDYTDSNIKDCYSWKFIDDTPQPTPTTDWKAKYEEANKKVAELEKIISNNKKIVNEAIEVLNKI